MHAQGFFDKLQTDIRRIMKDEAGVISDTLLRDMEDSLKILNSGYMENAAIEIGAYYDGQAQVGYEYIPESLIEDLRIASFTTHGVEDPRVADRTELISLIEGAKNRVSLIDNAELQGPPPPEAMNGEEAILPQEQPAETYEPRPRRLGAGLYPLLRALADLPYGEYLDALERMRAERGPSRRDLLGAGRSGGR